jgi:hypothetical protein
VDGLSAFYGASWGPWPGPLASLEALFTQITGIQAGPLTALQIPSNQLSSKRLSGHKVCYSCAMTGKKWVAAGRRWVWAVVIAAAVAGVAAQAQTSASSSATPDAQPTQITVAIPAQAEWSLQDRIRWGANLLLALAGYAGILMGLSLLRKIERQTRATETAAEAAADAGRAALTEARALLVAERPWVLISTEPSRTLENGFTVLATNRGRGPARILDAIDAARIVSHEGQLPAQPEFRRTAQPGEVFEPIVLLPGESVALRTFGREDVKRVCVADGSLERVDTWEDKIYVYGRVLYADLRTSGEAAPHETLWCCWYIHGRQKSGLVMAGPASYHRHS